MDAKKSSLQEKTLIEMMNDTASKHLSKAAVFFKDERIDYFTLREESDKLSALLRSQGIGKGDVVGLALDRSHKLIISLLGVIKSGAAFLPLDPGYPVDRIEYMLNDSSSKLLITEKAFEGQFKSGATEVFIEDLLSQDNEDYNLASTIISPTDLLYILYTSGSTGRPKGVQIEHGSFINFLMSMLSKPGMAAEDIILAITTVSFDIAGLELFLPLITGATIVLGPKGLEKDGQGIAEIIKKQSVTIMQATPGTWRLLLSSDWSAQRGFKALCGGEPLSKDLADKILSSGGQLWNMYGPTETTVWSSIKRIEKDSRITIGQPIDNTSFYILGNDGSVVRPGQVGDIWIGGRGVARGYVNRSELNSEKFRTIEINGKTDRIYHTGDLGYALPDGDYVCLGRCDDQVKIRGYRIELGEIETTLQKLPFIERAVVVSQPDSIGQPQLVSYIVTKERFSRLKTINYLKDHLPDYMVPRIFMQIEEIPLTPNGKIDKKSLPTPDAAQLSDTPYHSPETEIEQSLANTLKDILQVSKIGINDNFFEMGGNSLLAQRAASMLFAKGLNIPVIKLYQYPTIREIAGYLTGNEQNKIEQKKKRRTDDFDIAVIGMAARFPGANSIDEYWKNLKEAKASIHFFSTEEIDPSISASLRESSNYIKAKGLVDGPDLFDAAFFGINDLAAEVMDPQQRIFLKLCWEALESAGYSPFVYDKKIGVYAGAGYNSYYIKNVLPRHEIIEKLGEFQVMTLAEKDYLSSRVAFALNLRGPAVNVQSACSTSLLAISQAVESIRNGHCNMALAGGISIDSPLIQGHVYEEGSILSSNGQCRPFDKEASGTVFSDGGGVVLLKEKKQAELDGDTIYAVVKGVGINNDGGGKGSFTAPSAKGQAEAISDALADGAVEPVSVSYIETHGTATPLGDPIEIDGLRMVFDGSLPPQSCAIGSVKGNIGHLDTAAGVAGFIKTCLAIYHKEVPPSINYDAPNPLIDFRNSPFYVNAELRNWISDGPRRAGVSSFGIGGTNVHIILEEHSGSTERNSPSNPLEIITWSAKTQKSARNYLLNIKKYLDLNPEICISALAASINKVQNNFVYRQFAIIDTNRPHNSLDDAIIQEKEGKRFTESSEVCFVFPGQGSQYADMGKQLYASEPVFKKIFDDCALILKQDHEVDISSLVVNSQPNSACENLMNPQTTLAVFEYALAKLWLSWGVRPAVLIGHSLGELVAARIAGIFDLRDWLGLIVTREKILAGAPDGNMLAVRSDSKTIRTLVPPTLSIAAINSDLSCVVSGPSPAVEEFHQFLKSKSIASKLLDSKRAFHSPEMDDYVDPLNIYIQSLTINRPNIPIISTVSGTWLQENEAIDPLYWSNHLRRHVDFSKAVHTLSIETKMTVLECGPGNTLSLFIRQHDKYAKIHCVASLDPGRFVSESKSMLNALGNLWLSGVQIDLSGLHSGKLRRKVPIPTYFFDTKRYWLECGSVTTQQTKALNIPSTRISTRLEDRGDFLMNELKTVMFEASGIDFENIPSTKNFTDVGLDSLSLTQISQVIRKSYGVPLTFKNLMVDCYNLMLLAEYLSHHPASSQIKKTCPESSAGPVSQFIISDKTTSENTVIASRVFETSAQDLEDKIPNRTIMRKAQTNYVHDHPPIEGALLGKDQEGNPAWFLEDNSCPGRYLQIHF